MLRLCYIREELYALFFWKNGRISKWNSDHLLFLIQHIQVCSYWTQLSKENCFQGPDVISVSKYKKLASEYAKLKAHVQVLKTALLEIRHEKDTLSAHLKTREQDIRKLTQEQVCCFSAHFQYQNRLKWIPKNGGIIIFRHIHNIEGQLST